MKRVNICAGTLLLVVLSAGLAHPVAAMSAHADFSGIVSYVFEPNPQEIKPKMYNWEVALSKSDSQSGVYEIVQITRPKRTNSKGLDPAEAVLIESKMIAANQDGVVDFNLYVGNKAPKENMGRRGHSGEPIIFSGRGTGRGESNWIILPGSKIEQVVPTSKGTRLSDGRLDLIQFTVSDDHGEQFQVDVALRRK
jgi:hypothetical protein